MPSPAAGAFVRRDGVDIGRHHIRLDLVALDRRPGAAVVDRIDERKKVRCLAAVAELGNGQDRLHGGLAVRPTILAQPRRIALEVARIGRRLVEGTGEENRRPMHSRAGRPIVLRACNTRTIRCLARSKLDQVDGGSGPPRSR